MRKIAFALAAAMGCLLSTAGHAAGYVGGNIGAGHIEVDCDGTDSCKNSTTSYKLVGGYELTSNLYGELGYIDFGKAKATTTVLGQSVRTTARASGLMLGLAYQVPFGENWFGNVRLGAINMETKLRASAPGLSASDSETNVKAYVGLGFGYSFNPNLKFVGDADFSRAEYDDDEASVRSLSLGVRYDF
ncbi:MAG TPA: outer membrane beta-barrel protein [Ideonella sp.]|uniref:outer membrane beta-barrel protein n=1 Tax=Ideonella sp. TaxID=1929293 RepID=UPI002E3539AC|nr:outer membrane beta-barrel protein [Ideonella sp.]HEX5684115.1 outer membrane beta-barrel protein [Ideonella sp.]